MIKYCMFTDQGSREVNEDSAGYKVFGDRYCFVVADGLGGHGRGEEASALVKDVIIDAFNETCSIDDFLENAVVKAQEELMADQERKHTRNEMKTTVVALMVDELSMKWIHVGDSRLYRFQKNKMKERTIDHSVPQMLVLAGDMKEKKIRNHPDRNRLLKVMGIEWDSPQYSVSQINNVMETQAMLMCTDGFWELITEKEMEKLLKKSSTVEEWVDSMVQVIRKNGEGKNMDNFTAIAVWFE